MRAAFTCAAAVAPGQASVRHAVAAATGGICAGFTVTVNGQTFRGDVMRTIRGPISSIQVRGTFIEFDVTASSVATVNYLHTGKASPRADNAAGWHYTVQPPGQTRLCITNGRISAYDSPELATLVSHSATTAVWNVAAGGRIGFVIGEDAVEGGCRP